MQFDTTQRDSAENDNAAGSVRLRRLTPAAEIRAIVERCATGTNVTYAEVMGRSRAKPVVRVRHAAIAATVQRFPWMTYPQLGRVFDRDHSTIMTALKKLGALPERCKAGGWASSLKARTYGPHFDNLFSWIAWTLAEEAGTTTEGSTHEHS